MYKFVKFDADYVGMAKAENSIIEFFDSTSILLATAFIGNFTTLNKLSLYKQAELTIFIEKLFNKKNVLISIGNPIRESMSRVCSLKQDAYRHALDVMYQHNDGWYTVLHDFSIKFDSYKEEYVLQFYEVPYNHIFSTTSHLTKIYEAAERKAFIDDILQGLD